MSHKESESRLTMEKKLQKIMQVLKIRKIEVAVAIFLGIATLLVAWAGWIGGLHDGNQASNYTMSNNLAAEGNAEYNVAAQIYISDMFTWNTIANLKLDLDAAKEKGDTSEVKVIKTKIEKIKQNNCSPKLLEAMNKAEAEGNTSSPFENEEFATSYFQDAQKLLEESQKALEEGEIDNQRSDSYQLASVLYALVLFLLGIIGVLKDYHSRKIILIFSICILVFAFIYMLTIPMPTGFDITNFFNNR